MLQKLVIHQEIKSKSVYIVSGKYHKDIQKQSYQFTNPNTRLQPCECIVTPLPRRPAPTHRHKKYHLCLENPTAPSLLTSYPLLFVKFSLNSVATFCIVAPALLQHSLPAPAPNIHPLRLVLACLCTVPPALWPHLLYQASHSLKVSSCGLFSFSLG